jgi:fluoroacetyl-CoA thioesterase
MTTDLDPGLVGSVSLTVTDEDTAIALRSGDVPVLGTPRVVALAEEAACAALRGRLDADVTSVGVRIELDHRKATPVGGVVVAAATLDAVDGRKLDFTLSVKEGEEIIASGTHRRVIAQRSAFPAQRDDA